MLQNSIFIHSLTLIDKYSCLPCEAERRISLWSCKLKRKICISGLFSVCVCAYNCLFFPPHPKYQFLKIKLTPIAPRGFERQEQEEQQNISLHHKKERVSEENAHSCGIPKVPRHLFHMPELSPEWLGVLKRAWISRQLPKFNTDSILSAFFNDQRVIGVMEIRRWELDENKSATQKVGWILLPLEGRARLICN